MNDYFLEVFKQKIEEIEEIVESLLAKLLALVVNVVTAASMIVKITRRSKARFILFFKRASRAFHEIKQGLTCKARYQFRKKMRLVRHQLCQLVNRYWKNSFLHWVFCRAGF